MLSYYTLTCGDWLTPGDASGDAPGDAAGDVLGNAGLTVGLPPAVGEPLTGTEPLPETVPGGGGGELGREGGGEAACGAVHTKSTAAARIVLDGRQLEQGQQCQLIVHASETCCPALLQH